MSELLPRPVPADLSLAAALAAEPEVSPLGVWLRVRRPVAVAIAARVGASGVAPVAIERTGLRRLLVIDGDLGRLLERCSVIVIRLGACVTAIRADDLIRVRALRVVAGLPYPPTLQALRRLFPDALGTSAGVEVPLSHRSAEEVLAAFATARTPVLFSRVVYRKLGAPGSGKGRPVDSAPGGRLG